VHSSCIHAPDIKAALPGQADVAILSFRGLSSRGTCLFFLDYPVI
jgi:hypothetical protein